MGTGFSPLKRCTMGLVVMSLLFHALPGLAYYTKSKDKPIVRGIYPEYPKLPDIPGDKGKLIKRGEYLAKMGDCIACHSNTSEGGKPFAGNLAIDTPFGTFYSPNITPDKETGIGKWTEDDLINALHRGQSPEGSNYFPVFPYPYFAKISKDDVRAIYAYLMAIPPVKSKNKSLPFPFNLPGARFSLYGWNLLFFYPNNERYQYDPNQSKEWNRGAYIVNGLGHCSMCHTPLNVFGSPKQRYFLTGGFVDGFWAPNITKYGLKSASRHEVADVFVKGELINKAGRVAGPMAEVNHDSLQYLTEDDRLAIATYLKTIVSEEPFGLSPDYHPPNLKRGKQVYFKACHVCHQEAFMGAPAIGNGPGWFARVKQQGLRSVYRHAINGYNSMPVKGACVTCSDNDIISAVDYLLHESLTRSQWKDLKSGDASQITASGKTVYEENCSVCHAEGKLGAPKLGDKQVWKPLIAKNMDVLIENVVNGEHHPKNGGCKHCSTTEVIDAIKYMVKESKTKGNYSLW